MNNIIANQRIDKRRIKQELINWKKLYKKTTPIIKKMIKGDMERIEKMLLHPNFLERYFHNYPVESLKKYQKMGFIPENLNEEFLKDVGNMKTESGKP